MPSVALLIQNQKGLHARAAAKFVKCAENFDAEIWVIKKDTADGASVLATSIMGLMMLAASIGTELSAVASGPDADAALRVLKELVDRKFDEE